MKRFSLMILAIMLLAATMVNAQTDESCITSKCHETMGTMAYVHGPVGARICTVCHTPDSEKKHTFQLADEKENLCFNCHEESRDMMLEEHLHTPVSDGDCTGCHDPHQSDYKYTLKGDASELCFQCHKRDEFDRAFVHGPIGVGDCNACHSPHASAFEDQLINTKELICFNCHKEQQELMNKRHTHSPSEENCMNCHDPHSDIEQFLLPKSEPELCYDCHESISMSNGSEFTHEPTAEGKCNTCHNVHGSDNPMMSPIGPTELCFSCHTDLKEYVEEQDHFHGPIKDGDCNACHNPHGSENARILKKYFPTEFYMPYATENYASCFECHNKDLALDARTTTLTDFRDGDVNMHYLHVNKDVKGRSCKACHQVHASTQEKHIRTSVPFGKINWELPVTYTKFDDGGKCVVGCHAPKEYHRK